MLLVHMACALMMTGLCLFVAVVHYPLFARVGREGWVEYERAHTARTTVVVAPVMLVELVTCGWVSWGLHSFVEAGMRGWWWGSVGLLVVCWGVTFLVNVPQHGRLARGWDGPTHRGLVAAHWVRTAAWCVRSVVLVWVVSRS